MANFCVLLKSRGLIKVEGEDRAKFLQGLISNDIDLVMPDRAIWAALLTPQGKYLHDFFILQRDDALYLDCEAERLMDLGQRLRKYILRADVSLDVVKDSAVVAMFGDSVGQGLGLPKEVGAAGAWGGGVVYVDPRLASAGARAVLPSDNVLQAVESAGFVMSDRDAYDRMRLSYGLSDGSRDLIVEKSILLESNFDELHGVDWQKGCYMGQELTARTKYRGLVKKRLLPIRIEGPVPSPGAPVLDGGRNVGEVRSAIDGMGLALIRLDAMEKVEGDASFNAGEAVVTPWTPGWARPS
jgi:folate-binding protein YgfZ